VCTSCARIQYENPKVLVMSLITFGSRLLLVRRATAPQVGMWMPPAGFVELGETMDAAAAREVREEAGVVIDPGELHLHAVSNLPLIGEIYVCFRGVAESDAVRAGQECDDCRFFAHDEIPWDQLAYPQLASYIDRIFVESTRNAFSMHYTSMDQQGTRVNSYVIGRRRTQVEAAAVFETHPKGDYFDPTQESDAGFCDAATWRRK
jgi:ADP-ribose pyrophosphatase YjhB (NUDIX family)